MESDFADAHSWGLLLVQSTFFAVVVAVGAGGTDDDVLCFLASAGMYAASFDRALSMCGPTTGSSFAHATSCNRRTTIGGAAKNVSQACVSTARAVFFQNTTKKQRNRFE